MLFRDRLAGVDPRLAQAVEVLDGYLRQVTQNRVQVVVTEGVRSWWQQQWDRMRGVSWVAQSKHQIGRAVDLDLALDGRTIAPDYVPLAWWHFLNAVLQSIMHLRWGGAWSVRDYRHWEI